MGLFCGNALGESCNPVLAIPCRQLLQPGVHGVVLFDAGGVDEAVHILIPRLQSLLTRFDGHIVSHFFCQWLKCLILRIFHTILSHTRHQVLAHIVVGCEENFCPHRLKRLLRHTFQRLHLVLLAIVLHQCNFVGGAEYAFHQIRIVVKQRML